MKIENDFNIDEVMFASVSYEDLPVFLARFNNLHLNIDMWIQKYEYIDVVALGKTAAEVTGRPDARSLPQIYIDGKYIGGFAEAYEYVNQDDDVEEGVEADASYTNQDGNECVACEG